MPALSTLHHVIDLEWMREAYRLTRKDGASGIDDPAQPLSAHEGQTQRTQCLVRKLLSLVNRL